MTLGRQGRWRQRRPAEILAAARLNEYLTVASQSCFRAVAILPASLLLVFGAIWAHDRLSGGYRAVGIAEEKASL